MAQAQRHLRELEPGDHLDGFTDFAGCHHGWVRAVQKVRTAVVVEDKVAVLIECVRCQLEHQIVASPWRLVPVTLATS